MGVWGGRQPDTTRHIFNPASIFTEEEEEEKVSTSGTCEQLCTEVLDSQRLEIPGAQLGGGTVCAGRR